MQDGSVRGGGFYPLDQRQNWFPLNITHLFLMSWSSLIIQIHFMYILFYMYISSFFYMFTPLQSENLTVNMNIC